MGKFERIVTLEHSIIREVAGGLYAIGSLVATDAQQSITAGSVSGKNHVVSNPGEAPNNDSADLANGIEVIQVAPLKVQVESTAAHSIPLEYGTSKMAARPFFVPAVHRTAPKAQKMATALVNRALRRHFGQ